MEFFRKLDMAYAGALYIVSGEHIINAIRMHEPKYVGLAALAALSGTVLYLGLTYARNRLD